MDNKMELVDPVQDLETRSQQPVETAKNLLIVSQSTLEFAVELRRVIKGLMEEVDKVFDPIVSAAHKAHRAATSAKKTHREPLELAERMLVVRTDQYLNAQEKLRKKQEEEKLQQQREQVRQLEQMNLPIIPPEAGELPHNNNRPEPVLPKKFVAPPTPVHSIPLQEVARVEGLSKVEEWFWEVTDISLIPSNFWVLDDKAITSEVNRDKDKTNIPGIKVWSEIKSRMRK